MHNDQNRDELKVIEALGEGSPALTFEGIKEKTSFSNSKLEHILDPLLKKGIISETKTDENKEESEIEKSVSKTMLFVFKQLKKYDVLKVKNTVLNNLNRG